MLQQDDPDNYVIGTGESHSVREFVGLSFKYAGLEVEWKGEGAKEKGILRSISSKLQLPIQINIGDTLVEIDPKYFRPTEVDFLCADITKAKKKLGWTPKVTFEELIMIMVDSDMELMGIQAIGKGKKILEEKGIHWTS